MKLSIIIPVYNTEKTLERCLKSVLHQCLDDFEVILVDDGSKDNCGTICEEWHQKDPRMVVIHKDNGGLSDARNVGLDICKGDYVTFLDSDDEIGDDTLNVLLETLMIHTEYDMIEYPVFVHYRSKEEKMLRLNDKTYSDMLDDYWLKDKGYTHTYAWNKIYKRRIFDNIRYPKGMKFEDVYVMPSILKECKKIATCSSGVYYYYKNPDGITQTATGNTLNDLLLAHISIFSEIRKKTTNMADLMDYYMHIVNIQCDVYEMTGNPIRLPSIHIGYKLLSDMNISFQTLIKIITLDIFGLSRLCFLNKILHKILRCH